MQNCRSSGAAHRRLHIVDVMQGIAMLWVVIGHHLLEFMPPIYDKIHYYIYSFHMPYFIFISSFLIAYSYRGQAYVPYVYKKFHKFFIPYVIVGILISGLTAFQCGFDSFPVSLLNLLISPKESDATFLWYIYLLFFLYAIYPLCEKGLQRFQVYSELVLLLMGIFLYLRPWNIQIFCLDYFSKYFLFYVLGIISAKYFALLRNHLPLMKILGICCLLLFIWLSSLVFVQSADWVYSILCFIAIPAMSGLSYIFLRSLSVKRVLESISRNCFHIYLLHMFFIQGIAIVFIKLYPHQIESWEFMWVYLLLSSIISIIGSIWVFRFLDIVSEKIKKTMQ